MGPLIFWEPDYAFILSWREIPDRKTRWIQLQFIFYFFQSMKNLCPQTSFQLAVGMSGRIRNSFEIKLPVLALQSNLFNQKVNPGRKLKYWENILEEVCLIWNGMSGLQTLQTWSTSGTWAELLPLRPPWPVNIGTLFCPDTKLLPLKAANTQSPANILILTNRNPPKNTITNIVQSFLDARKTLKANKLMTLFNNHLPPNLIYILYIDTNTAISAI